MARVSVTDADGLWGGVVDGEVGGDFAGAFPSAAALGAFAIDQAKHLWGHEAFADARGGANEAVWGDACGDISSVAVAIFAHPNTPTDVTNLLLDGLRFGAGEEAKIFRAIITSGGIGGGNGA